MFFIDHVFLFCLIYFLPVKIRFLHFLRICSFRVIFILINIFLLCQNSRVKVFSFLNTILTNKLSGVFSFVKTRVILVYHKTSHYPILFLYAPINPPLYHSLFTLQVSLNLSGYYSARKEIFYSRFPQIKIKIY